jgi:hypothetical protein
MDGLRPGLIRIRNLVIAQRTVRLLVRAAWLGLAGFLVAWGLNALYGWFPDQRHWTAAAVLFAAPPLVAAFRPLRLGRLAWRMDRLLGLQEQVTTALRVDEVGADQTPVARTLVDEVSARSPLLHTRIAGRGWNLGRDLEALAVVVLLLGTIILSYRTGIQFSPSLADPAGLPALDRPPGFSDVFPSGIPGLTAGAPGGVEGNTGPGAPGPGEEALNDLDNILSDLGESLSEHPETADIGEALQNGDLEGAAAAIERTADDVDLLPEDARQNLQESLQQAAQQAEEAGAEDLAEDLQAAAQALDNVDPNNPLAADALDELADSLRDLGEAFASMGQPGEQDGGGAQEGPEVGSSAGESGSGSGAGVQGLPEPLSRLEGEGEDFSIEGGDDPSGLLQPAGSPGTPVTTTGGEAASGGGTAPGTTGPINSVLTPYSFPWNWRDVVSDYFSP